MKLAILFGRLGPYHHARLRAAGALCDLTAIEFSVVDKTYAWDIVAGADGFRRMTLLADADFDEKSRGEVRNALWDALALCRPDVVAIPGWATTPVLLALAWCRRHNIPAILMSDSQEIDEPRVWWKEWPKAQIVRQFSAGFVAGTRHVDYLQILGLPRPLIFTGYDVVDNAHFSKGAEQARINASELRGDFALPDNFFLTSCRFVEKKNLAGLVDGYAQYCKFVGSSAWHLVIIGDGPLRSLLEEQIRRLDLTAQIHLPGFKQYDELPYYYGLANTYIQASTTEQWGLVVNEAMASGLPVLVSDRCGCAPDLVQEGINGYTFDPVNVEVLVDLMARITIDRTKLECMGQASRKIIANWTPDTFAKNLIKAADTAIAQPRTKASWFNRAILKGLIYR